MIIKKRMSEEGLDPSRINTLMKRADLKTSKISEAGETEDKGQSFAVSYVLMFVLYISLLVYGITIMRSVIEEKSSRIVEVLVSSVRPYDLMMGKLIRVGAVGLTQVAI